MILDGKTVMVSGVGPGLGREIGAAAARDGAQVMLAARTEANLIKADGDQPVRLIAAQPVGPAVVEGAGRLPASD
jgi:NAD(P)-dependent dehydrogenase (short-subunit alcohol dehydrogenase family)